MGNPDTMTFGALKAINECQALAGAERMVESVLVHTDRKDYNICHAVASSEIFSWIKNDGSEKTAVLMSGDTGFFSGSKKLAELIKNEGGYETEILPGISSLQYFSSKLQLSWDDTKVVSLHGRTNNFLNEVRNHEKVFFLTDSKHSPDYICRCLLESGLGETKVHVGERLSYSDEKITSGTAEKLADMEFSPLSVVLVRNGSYEKKRVVTHGIPDEEFIRGKVPMTKEEVRSVTLSKLKVCKDDIIYDIGAGTGSVSVELALQASGGSVYAIETGEEAVSLIHENKKNFNADNLHVIKGMAPEAMKELPKPDKAFIGGSKGNMAEIVRVLLEKNPKVRISINVIALESLTEAIKVFEEEGFEDVDIVQVSAARAKQAGRYHLMTAQNPVFIITGQKEK